MVAEKLTQKIRGCVRRGDFTLSSGKKSNFYIDIKGAISEPEALDTIASEMAKLIKDERPDRIAGVAVGAVPLATALSLKTGIPFLIVRKEKKGYGTGAQVDGSMKPGENVIVVEDVTTTGMSSLAAVEALRAMKARCDRVVAVVDREEGSAENLSKHGVRLIALFKAGELLKGPRPKSS